MTRKQRLILVVIALVLVFLVFGGGRSRAESNDRRDTICHRDQGRPEWKVIEVDVHAIAAHLSHQWGEDIYPVPVTGCPVDPPKPTLPPGDTTPTEETTVVTFAPCMEGEPCWDCETMGNQMCGTPTTESAGRVDPDCRETFSCEVPQTPSGVPTTTVADQSTDVASAKRLPVTGSTFDGVAGLAMVFFAVGGLLILWSRRHK